MVLFLELQSQLVEWLSVHDGFSLPQKLDPDISQISSPLY